MTTKSDVIRLMAIYGTRPEAIKLAPVIHRARADSHFSVTVCVTAQHREMLDQVHALFGVAPDIDLDLMTPNQSLPDLAGRAIPAVAASIRSVRPHVVVVQGDTTTCMAAALAAFLEHVPVAHVEAGLRTHDLAAPFPEELNRQLVARMARWNFAPTERARQCLLQEGIPSDRILVTGNTAIDALHDTVARLDSGTTIPQLERFPFIGPHGRLLLVTAHRRESFGPGFQGICRGIRVAADEDPQLHVIYPVHPNPNVREPVSRELGSHPRIHLVEPLPYATFVALLRHAWVVLTDSGGIQEEAPGLGKPVLVMRDVTERPEAVDAGTARLVGTNADTIATAIRRLRESPAEYMEMSSAKNPFGDGKAADRIVNRLGLDLVA